MTYAQIADDIDQITTELPDAAFDTPLSRALSVAWWWAENRHREEHNGECSDERHEKDAPRCGTCRHYRMMEVRARLARI